MQEERFSYLFEQHYNKLATKDELDELMTLIHSGKYDLKLEVLTDTQYEKFSPQKSPISKTREEELLNSVLNSRESVLTQPFFGKTRTLWTKIAVAASILFCLSMGMYFYNSHTEKQVQALAVSLIGPGSDKAKLILGSGQVILLDSLQNGLQLNADGARITKSKDGQLIYEITGAGQKKGDLLNSIETPRGGQYQVRLPDGTGVWLNAATTLKFANTFQGSTRTVTLIGEAYFEVAQRKDQPFIVQTEGQVIEVLGTHFNVSAYPDEDKQQTTLLEGRVKSSHHSQSVILQPGQQALLEKRGTQLKKIQADVETVMAWKNGDFIFKDESLASVMKKVERWYDVDVVFEGIDPEQIKLGGWVSRKKNIAAVLNIIEPIAGIQIKVEGRRITVMK